MRRVLLHIPGNTYGGAHNQARLLWQPLLGRGYDCAVLLPEEPGNAQAQLAAAGLEVFTLPLARLRASGDPRTVARTLARVRAQAVAIAELMRENAIDMIQVHGFAGSLDGLLAAQQLSAPLIWQVLDSRAPRPLRYALGPALRRRSDAILTTGRALQEQIPNHRKSQHRIFHYLPPVANDQRAQSERQLIRKRLGVAHDAFLIGTVANLNPQKNLVDLLHIQSILQRRISGVALRIRGATSETHRRHAEFLQTTAARLSLEPSTIGPLESGISPMDMLHALDVFVLTSTPKSEGIPTALLEAFACGVPAVAYSVGAVREVVIDEVTGFCLKPGDVSAACRRLELLATHPDALHKLRTGAAQFAAQHVGVRGTLDRYVAAYDEAWSNRMTSR